MTTYNPKLSTNDKILLAIYELQKNKKNGEKITKEDMVIKAWKMFPADFCIKGYPQYPNADISKYVTKLFKDNLLKGSFYNYSVTPKGIEYAKALTSVKQTISEAKAISGKRELEVEINRIKNSKVFKLFLNGEKNFLESDFFDFLGTSSRTLSDSNKTAFKSKYNLIIKEVIPFCKNAGEKDAELANIVMLSELIFEKFKNIIDKESLRL